MRIRIERYSYALCLMKIIFTVYQNKLAGVIKNYVDYYGKLSFNVPNFGGKERLKSHF